MTETVRYTFIKEDIDSSALEALWYDLPGRRLYVEFPNGQVAGYKNVGPEIVKSLLMGGFDRSIGSYFARNVKGVYPGTTGDVNFEPYNSLSDSNTNPATIGNPAPEPEPVEPEPDYDGTYEIAFTIEGTTEFEAPAGDILAALEKFVGTFSENNKDMTVRVRSIKEIV